MSKPLDKKTACNALQGFFKNKPFVLFGTGTSCAIHTGFGMDNLRKFLLDQMRGEHLAPTQQQEWESLVSRLDQGSDFESSMNAIQDEGLRLRIIELTATLVGAFDLEYGPMILSGAIEWPAANLLKRIVEKTDQTDCIVHVATTNYDLLAEYAFESKMIPYLTGFYGGICRQLDWEKAERNVLFMDLVVRKTSKVSHPQKYERHIRLYKVHGSLNTFKLKDKIVQNNAWTYGGYPRESERVMITPGTAKYEALHYHRSDLLGKYDDAVLNSRSFLFIGFGFNDSQLINDKIIKKLKDEECPGLILTRDSNPRIENYIKACKNLWLVCLDKQDGIEGTRISNSLYETSLFLAGEHLWDASEFTRVILGG